MKRYEIKDLSLLRGRDLKLTETVSVKHPTLGDIEELGYEEYFNNLFSIISDSLDLADILWFENKIWYEDIKDEWLFFIQRNMSERLVSVKIVDAQGRLIKIEKECLTINEICRDAFNFFFNLTGEYIIMEKTVDNTKQIVLYNVVPDDIGMYILNDSSFVFTKFFYELTVRFLRDINHIKQDYDFAKGGNKRAKRYILKNQYDKKKKGKKEKDSINLMSIVSSLIAKGHSNIWEYPIYLVYDVYYRLVKIDEYNNTITAYYNQLIDTKKNPINWEKINWSGVID